MNDLIYSAILGPLVTMLVCFATGSFMLREGGSSLTNRLFGIINLLIFLMAATAICAYILPTTATYELAMVQMLAFFLPPVSLHLVQAKLERPGRHIAWLYGLAGALALASLLGLHVQPLFWLMSAAVLAAMLAIEYRALRHRQLVVDRNCLLGLDLILILVLLSVSLDYPLTNLSFVIIPLVAYGLVQDLDRSLLKRGLLASLLLTVLLLPIAANLTLLLRHLGELRLDLLAQWFFPYGLTPLITLAICFTVVLVSFQQAHSRTESLLLTIFAMLWASFNLRDLMLIVMPASAEILTYEIGSLFQAAILGVGPHLLARLVGINRPRIQGFFYALSLGLILLGLIPGLETTILRGDSPAILAKGPRVWIYLTSMGLGIAYCFELLITALRRAKGQTADLQLKIVLVSAVLALLIFVGNLPSHLGWRDQPFNYLNGLPLVLLALGVFNIPRHDALQVFSRALRIFLSLAYLTMVPIVLWLLNHYAPADLSGQYLFVSWLRNSYAPTELGGSYMSWSLPALASCLIAGFLSLAVLRLEQSRTETLIFAMACCCYALHNFDILMATVLTNSQVILTISRIDHLVLTALLLGIQVHLIHLVCGVDARARIVKLAYGVGFVIAPFTQTDLYFKGVQQFSWGHFPIQGPLYSLMGLFWLGATLYCAQLMLKTYRKQTDQLKRNLLRYVMIGFCLTAVLSLTNLPISYGYALPPLGSLVLISMGFLTYGLFRHNLNATLQFARRLIFALGLALLLAGLYYLPLMLPLGSHETRHFIGLVLVMILGLPLVKAWNGVLSLFIRHAADDLRQEFSRLSAEMSLSHHRQEIHSCLSRWLFEVLDSSQCQTLLRQESGCFAGWRSRNPAEGFFAQTPEIVEEELCLPGDHPLLGLDFASLMWEDSLEISQLKATGILHGTDSLLPVKFQGQLMAFVVVGGKLNGAPYFWSERQTLSALTELLGAHLENARLLEGLEATVEERTMELNRSLADAMLKEKELRAKGQIISRQNLIMRVLIETSNSIQQLGDVEQIMSLGLEQIHRLFNDQGSLLLIEPENRPAYVLSRNLSASEEAYLIDNRATLMDEDLNSRLAGAVFDLNASRPGFTALPLKGLGDQALGKALIRLAHHADNDLELLELFLNRISIQAQSQLLIDELARLASTDSMTGVHNRAYFNQELERAGRQYKRYPQSGFSLMILDINGLKEVNDTYGHMKGDEMIVSVAEYLKRSCRATDIIARLGGDEFAVLMPTTDRAQAETLLARFRAAKLPLECQKPDGETETLPVSFSIGLAATEEVEVDKIMNTADDRMYQDKEGYYQNRNRYR